MMNEDPNKDIEDATKSFTVEAVYEDGVLKPINPLPLMEKQVVIVTIGNKVSEEVTLPWTEEEQEALRQMYANWK